MTPKQWDLLKSKIEEIDNMIPMSGVIVDHNTFKINDQGFHQTPSHHYGISSGSNVTYTTNGAPNWYSSNMIENDSREK